MTVTLGHLGAITYAIQESLSLLGVKVVLPDETGTKESELGVLNLKTEICHPLKLLLGNYLSIKEEKPDSIIFYNGCDLCNLSAIYDVFLNIFAQDQWYPKAYYFDVKNDLFFLKDYFMNLKKISNKSSLKVIRAIFLGFQKFFLLEYLDKAFCLIRPTFEDVTKCENIYAKLFKKIISAHKKKDYDKIKREIESLLTFYPPNYELLHIGLIGDPFSLMEPFSHQFTNIKLGHLGVVVDRWLNNKLIIKKYRNNFEIKDILKNKYGVLTDEEFDKINKYVRKSYDGLVFIAPFSCNPNDALRNQLFTIQEKTGIPVLSLSFDSHTSATGLETRLEAFVDLVKRKGQKENIFVQ